MSWITTPYRWVGEGDGKVAVVRSVDGHWIRISRDDMLTEIRLLTTHVQRIDKFNAALADIVQAHQRPSWWRRMHDRIQATLKKVSTNA